MAPAASKLRLADTSTLDPQWWSPGTGQDHGKWKCSACEDEPYMTLYNARRHNSSEKHTNAMKHKSRVAAAAQDPGSSTAAPPAQLDALTAMAAAGRAHGPVRELLEEWSDEEYVAEQGEAGPSGMEERERTGGQWVLDWEAISTELHGDLAPSAAHRSVTGLASSLAEWLTLGDTISSSDSSSVEEEPVEDDVPSVGVLAPDPLAFGARREARTEPDPVWYPWPDRITCVLDIIRHLPRSLFSDNQMEIILWSLAVMGIDERPSLTMLKTVDELLQRQCGIESIRYKGPLGHVYYANDMGSIMAQELGNPQTRPHLRFYPEAAASPLKESWQFRRWLHELSPELASPMIRIWNQDFYLHEPALLSGQEKAVVIPFRWFTRYSHQSKEQELYGEAWRLAQVTSESPTATGGGADGYVVHSFERTTFAATALVSSLPRLVEMFEEEGIPDPRNIVGAISERGSGVLPWTLTDPLRGNAWRTRAKSHRVLAFPIWLYCDDTSGNMSKKWNKHNSWLFTAAGLPRIIGQHESNIHFLATSNRAPPLEMLDGIVSQLEQGQREGFWAWDCQGKEMVLLIPSVLGILGDNPMQSEIACHVGLAGRMFCRACYVRGRDSESERGEPSKGSGVQGGSPTSTAEESASGSDLSGHNDDEPTRHRPKETLQELVNRATRFLGYNKDRDREDTLKYLQGIFKESCSVGGAGRAKKKKTEYGVKDTFQDFFLDQITSFSARLRGPREEKQEVLDMFVATEIPKQTRSPVYRILDFDPNQDTPVEVLHVVLLGFVKYFWRDAVARIPKDRKEVLKIRLSSLDVSAMGIAPLSGETLVTYAGSLTGRDFRTISQVAPFVLYDMVPNECYETWLAMCAMVPLIWQPEIIDLESHLKAMENAIEHFLTCTARWTPRWFNKPKFHIIRHLPQHVRRFGPAILFATEGFESFNAIIRSRSIHSNRQAPSRDIARGFARVNRIRHLLSGGFFVRRQGNREPHVPRPFSDDKTSWVSAAVAPLRLRQPRLGVKNVISDYFGIDRDELGAVGELGASCVQVPNAMTMRWGSTATARQIPSNAWPERASTPTIRCRSVNTTKNVSFKLDDWVISSHTGGMGDIVTRNMIGRVREILQIPGSQLAAHSRANFILLETFAALSPLPKYCLPKLEPTGWEIIDPESIQCTVNVQHNCASNQCDESATMPVYQEQEAVSTGTRAAVNHKSPDDVMLNTMQMRNALHVQQFRLVPPPIDRNTAIQQGAVSEIEAQRAPKAKVKASGQARTPLSVALAKSLLKKPSGMLSGANPATGS